MASKNVLNGPGKNILAINPHNYGNIIVSFWWKFQNTDFNLSWTPTPISEKHPNQRDSAKNLEPKFYLVKVNGLHFYGNQDLFSNHTISSFLLSQRPHDCSAVDHFGPLPGPVLYSEVTSLTSLFSNTMKLITVLHTNAHWFFTHPFTKCLANWVLFFPTFQLKAYCTYFTVQLFPRSSSR